MWSSDWVKSIMDIDRSPTEFTGDDVDQYSSVIDLGDNYEFVEIIIPTITSSTTGIAIQMNEHTDSVPSIVYVLDDDATGCFLHATTAATTAMTVVFRLGAARWFRIKMGSNQAADRTFYCRGLHRVTTG